MHAGTRAPVRQGDTGAQCAQYLSGAPINLANRERRRDTLDTTGRFAAPDMLSDSADVSIAIAEFMGRLTPDSRLLDKRRSPKELAP